MAHLIDDLLELSRVSRRELCKVEVDLSGMASQVAEVLARAFPDRPVDFRVRPAMLVRADPGLLRIAMENLLGNAWKFSSRTPNPKVEVGSLESDGKKIYFVRDNGAGFNMRFADRLFAPHQRLHSQSEFEGSGIGLNIVLRIIERHEGRIFAQGEEGQGASFFFSLPS